MEKKCEFCGENFWTPRRKTKFCKQRCYWDHKKTNFPRGPIEAMRKSNIGRRTPQEYIDKVKKTKEEKRNNLTLEVKQLKLAKAKSSKLYYTLIGRARGWKKKNKTIEELGYTPEEFRVNMEEKFLPGMTWANHGRGREKWHVDHIRPISSFELGTSPKVVNALNNLQPLWEEENLSKSKRYEQWERTSRSS